MEVILHVCIMSLYLIERDMPENKYFKKIKMYQILIENIKTTETVGGKHRKQYETQTHEDILK